MVHTANAAPRLFTREETLALKREISETRIKHAQDLRYRGWKQVVQQEQEQLARIAQWQTEDEPDDGCVDRPSWRHPDWCETEEIEFSQPEETSR